MDVSKMLKYLEGDMPEQERKLFEQALDSDQTLRYKLQLVKELEDGVVDEKTLALVFKLEKIKRQYKLLCDQDITYEAPEPEIRLLIKEVDTIALLEEFISDKGKVHANDCPETVSVSNKLSVRYSLKKALAVAAVICIAFVTSVYYFRPPSNERLFSQNYEKYPAQNLRYSNPETDVKYLYATGDFRGAADLSLQIFRTDPFNSIAHFYSGLSLLELKQYRKAIEHLSLAAASEDKVFSYAARWYLSLCYLKTEQINSSKKILYSLANSRSLVYSNKARALLKDMK